MLLLIEFCGAFGFDFEGDFRRTGFSKRHIVLIYCIEIRCMLLSIQRRFISMPLIMTFLEGRQLLIITGSITLVLLLVRHCVELLLILATLEVIYIDHLTINLFIVLSLELSLKDAQRRTSIQ
jgi:hypothetical protein